MGAFFILPMTNSLPSHTHPVEQQMSAYTAAWDSWDKNIRSAIQDDRLIRDIAISKIKSRNGPEPKYHCARDNYRITYP